MFRIDEYDGKSRGYITCADSDGEVIAARNLTEKQWRSCGYLDYLNLHEIKYSLEQHPIRRIARMFQLLDILPNI